MTGLANPIPVSEGDKLQSTFVSLADLDAILSQWRDLTERALEPNAFYLPEVVTAALRSLPEGRKVRVLIAWRGRDDLSRGRLVGLLPVVDDRRRFLVPLPLTRAAELMATSTTPLIDRDRPAETLAAMLDHLGGTGVGVLTLGYVRDGGPVAKAFEEATRDVGLHLVRLREHDRAALGRDGSSLRPAPHASRPQSHKEIRRQRRRLADLGRVAFRIAATAMEVAGALEDFLDLEARGWKGRQGTAIRHADGAEAYLRRAVSDLSKRGDVRIATLALDDRPIASGIVFISGSRAFYFKTAYDETLARLSPGALLALELGARLLDDPRIVEVDSLAMAGHPMIDRLWTGRLPVVTLLVATTRRAAPMVRAAAAAERLRETSRVSSLELRAWMRRRRMSRKRHRASK